VTTLRPERPADDGPMSYEDTGQFEVVVGRLSDPLNDPLPGRPPAVPDEEPPEPAPDYPDRPEHPAYEAPASARPDEPTSLWFRAPEMDQPPSREPAPAPPEAFVRPEPVPPEAFVRQEAARPEAFVRPDPVPPVPPPVPLVPPGPPEAFVRPEPMEPGMPRAPGVPGAPEGEEPVDETVQQPVLSPVLGPPSVEGRAARRKAAKGGGGHRARNNRGAPATPPATAAQESAAPLSRIEARRAAKAAKESPAVVISRVVGELFITIGVLMLLFVTYQLWWTNVRAHAQANSASNKLEQQWDTAQGDPNRAPGTFSPGQGFAIMYIPKLDVKAPIAQGVNKTKVLDKGMVGHYDGALNTAMPWDKTGNFAVAAHRNTHGEPFRYINHLVPGDKVVVETATTYYTYEITHSLASTPPTNTGVLQPVPAGSGFTQPGRYLTLTTCTPEFTSTNRLIVWGKLVEERPRSKGKPDALVNG
jgi:sortase A